MSKKPTIMQRVKAKLDALAEAKTVIFTEFRDGDYFVVIVPTWISGMAYYRFVSWTRFHERTGLPIMSNTYFSGRNGMNRIFAAARSELSWQ